ncbi:mannosidase, endo-alpha, putative [Perkinsus marinus ATCC 50983]|uniref:Mannosidase, endo-alpha, putative n=1 Tax=Perkinsus marinus (strain ATCC 50983 / TXsc) TaxID=423536 RepID=C5KWY1_PERM5|nr:mannosidase, endo-alpha, putative [Perkinsus marinus ATCC 50983]EER10985.1 mannosidase, endo-alpha, putative [Perkinsus marinus ATCC 50983]|eukprot:XP_002779190.1 mannosidase, endo-alpha, putative [Perkinsus marinus ATCC 50983]
MWYRNKDRDGNWSHWNHQRLSHWDQEVAKKYAQDEHIPENDDIGSSYWPQLGPYSSLDPQTIATHMDMMKRAGLGVAVVSWYPPGLHDPALDDLNQTVDILRALLLDIAWAHGMRVAIHLEPYEGRTPSTVRKDFEYIHTHYGEHPALHRVANVRDGTLLPLVYIYDSYHNSPEEWARLLTPNGDLSVRGKTGLDCTAIFLWVEAAHSTYTKSGFDGFYTYFAAAGFVYGSTPSNWLYMGRVAQEAGIYFIPSVGPGYIDVEVRPWNFANTRDRRDGQYFDHMFSEAARLRPKMVSITSFNEWHEGTNIEPALYGKSTVASLTWPARAYLNYGSDPEFYLTKTKQWVERMFGPPGLVIP